MSLTIISHDLIKHITEGIISESFDEANLPTMESLVKEGIVELLEAEDDKKVDEEDDDKEDKDVKESEDEDDVKESDDEEEQLDEAAGNLRGLPSAIIKAIAGTHTSVKGGANSPITSAGVTKAKTALYRAITDGLNKSQHVIIKRGIDVIASIHPDSDHSKEVNVYLGNEAKRMSAEVYSFRHGRSYSSTQRTFARGRAIDMIVSEIEKNGGFSTDITVQYVGIDTERLEKRNERDAARKDTRKATTDARDERLERVAQAFVSRYLNELKVDFSDRVNKFTKILNDSIANGDLQSARSAAKQLDEELVKAMRSDEYQQLSQIRQQVDTVKWRAKSYLDSRSHWGNNYDTQGLVKELKRLRQLALK